MRVKFITQLRGNLEVYWNLVLFLSETQIGLPAMAPTERPILFHYPQSIYSHRVLWYLWLSGLEYDECVSFIAA